ncbi:hypothetical protein ACFV29_34985 [Streptomyces sp. NPDC059690]|uniref:hypothetical protein n=1 Tax=Streptomyces sp. NPDC059690 TaxID=3346907 RepID=UPI0036CA311A
MTHSTLTVPELLPRVPLFDGHTREQLAVVSAGSHIRTVDRGTILFCDARSVAALAERFGLHVIGDPATGNWDGRVELFVRLRPGGLFSGNLRGAGSATG